ncbi:MAG: hypothetical protein H6605_11140 [Flavobacteriales bacterium]|nr:hypothetical protein [Flavobacteriales bacterium]
MKKIKGASSSQIYSSKFGTVKIPFGTAIIHTKYLIDFGFINGVPFFEISFRKYVYIKGY